MAENYFIYGCDTEKEVSDIQKFDLSASLKFISVDEFLKNVKATSEDKVIVYAERDEIKAVFEQSFIYGFSIALMAKKTQRYLQKTFEIPKDPRTALQTALEGEVKPVDLLYADDEIVLWGALVGEAPPHGVTSQSYLDEDTGGKYKALAYAFQKIAKLKKAQVHIKTHKGQEIRTSVTGIVIVEHDDHSCASGLVKNFMSASNGKVVALLISPSSVVDYFNYLYKAIFRRNKSLPESVGVILSEEIVIESTPPLEVRIDSNVHKQTPVAFTVHKKAVKLCASEKFWEKEAYRQSDDKEVIKLGNLPLSSEMMEYEQKHIPFFTHADTRQYQDLFVNLREEARASNTFITLMVLSTVLATVGLFLNSASVIIGAMLLAPLMQPIVSFSMGLLRFDMDLFWHGLRSVGIGVLLVLLLAGLTAVILPFQSLTNEIAGRLHPTLLDLIVAIVSGIAAAYAKNNPKIIGSLAGVSIAVALVPPVATAGIGIGWGDWSIFKSAFLLFLTNFAGIIFAASLTFVVLGFSPVKRAKNGLFISLAALILISIPLYFSFSFMVKDARIKQLLEKSTYTIKHTPLVLENIYVTHDHGGTTVIRCDVITQKHLGQEQRHMLKTKISEKIKPYLDKGSLHIESLERLKD